jgi:hypothetical protein
MKLKIIELLNILNNLTEQEKIDIQNQEIDVNVLVVCQKFIDFKNKELNQQSQSDREADIFNRLPKIIHTEFKLDTKHWRGNNLRLELPEYLCDWVKYYKVGTHEAEYGDYDSDGSDSYDIDLDIESTVNVKLLLEFVRLLGFEYDNYKVSEGHVDYVTFYNCKNIPSELPHFLYIIDERQSLSALLYQIPKINNLHNRDFFKNYIQPHLTNIEQNVFVDPFPTIMVNDIKQMLNDPTPHEAFTTLMSKLVDFCENNDIKILKQNIF